MKRSIKTILAWLLVAVCVFTSIPISNVKAANYETEERLDWEGKPPSDLTKWKVLDNWCAGMEQLNSDDVGNSLISTGLYPRKHWENEKLSPGNAIGNVRVYRLGVGVAGDKGNQLILSNSVNWKTCPGCIQSAGKPSENHLLRLHNGLMVYEQQNWVPVKTDSKHCVGVVYDKYHDEDKDVANTVASAVQTQEGGKAIVHVSKALNPSEYRGGYVVLKDTNCMNALFVNATRNEKFKSMCLETDEEKPVKVDNKEYIFNAELLRALSGKSPEEIAHALHIIGANQSFSDFKAKIGSQIETILGAGHYTGLYTKAWSCSAITDESVTVNGLPMANNPTIDVMGNLTAIMCLYVYTGDDAYRTAISKYLEQIAKAMETKRTDGDMSWTKKDFACISVEQLVPVQIGTKVYCLSAPELMAAACDGFKNLGTVRHNVLVTFGSHATIGITNDCWYDFEARVCDSLDSAWKGKDIAEIYASMLNWYHNTFSTDCDSGCELNAHGLQAAVQDALGIAWKHDDEKKLVCKSNVNIEAGYNSSHDVVAYIYKKNAGSEPGKCFLSGILTNTIGGIGGYGILSSTVSHEAKYPKPNVYGTFDVSVAPPRTDTKPDENTKLRLSPDDGDYLADPFKVNITYTFDKKKNKDVIASIQSGLESLGEKWTDGKVKVAFKVYMKAKSPSTDKYMAPSKYSTFTSSNNESLLDNKDLEYVATQRTTLEPDSKEVGAPGKKVGEKFTRTELYGDSKYSGIYVASSKADIKKLIEGGSVTWQTSVNKINGLKKKGHRIFVYRVDCFIKYEAGGTVKTITVTDTKDQYKDGKPTDEGRHYEHRQCAADDGGHLRIMVSFKNGPYEDCTPDRLILNSFPKPPNGPCVVTGSLGWAKTLAKEKYDILHTEPSYWKPQVEVDNLLPPKGQGAKLTIPDQTADVEVKKDMRIGKKDAQSPIATIFLHTDQDPPTTPPPDTGSNKTSYTVQYYFNEVYDPSCDKVVNNQTINSTATVEFPDESEHKEGYSFDKCSPQDPASDHKATITLKANGSENILKVYYVETKFKYTSTIAKPYAEIKCGKLEQGGSQEPYEAMAGFPTTEDLYFGSGGNETIADVEYEYKKNGKATRKYTFTNELPPENDWGRSYDYKGGDTDFADMTKTEAFNAFTQLVERLNAGNVTHKSPGVNMWTCPSCGTPYGDEDKDITGLWDDSEGAGKFPGTYRYGQWKLVCDSASSWGHKYMNEKKGQKCTYREPVEEGPPSDPCGNVPYFEAMDAVTANDHHGEPTDDEKKQEMIGECHHGDGDAPPPSTRDVIWYPVRWNFHAEYTPVMTNVPDNTLTWTQDVEGFNYNQINKACVWGLTESLVNGTDKLTTEAKIKGSLMDQGADVRYNIANANTSEAGRLLYSVSKDKHDNVTWIGAPFTDDEGVCPHCVKAWTAKHLADSSKNGVGIDPLTTYNEVTCISDFLMQRTSAGDLSYTYDEYKAGNTATTPLISKLEYKIAEKDNVPIISTEAITFTEANKSHKYSDIVGNQTTFKGIDLKPQDMPFCGYSGNFKNTSGKYRTSWSAKSNINMDDKSLAIDDLNYSSSEISKKQIPAAVPATVRLGKNAIDVPDMDVRNGHYVLGTSSVFYKRLVSYNRDPDKVSMVYEKDDTENGVKALNQQSNADYGGQEGIVLTTTYSPNHGNINDVVVHDPVTCQYSMFFNTDGARDQRVTEGGIVADTPEVASCPGIAIDCPYSHLECSYNKNGGSVVHSTDCFLNTDDYLHQSNPVCNNPHHQNSRNIRYYLWGWRNSDDYSEYEYRSGTDNNKYSASYVNDAATPANLCSKVYIAQNALTGSYCLVSRGSVTGSIVANGEGGYTSTGQVTAVDSNTGATFNVSTYYDGAKNVLCLWDPVCDEEKPLFDGSKLKNPIFHEPNGDETCWKACMNPAKHQKNPSVTVDGKTYNRNPKFLNLDREFYLYFPNTGDFAGDGAFGIDKVQKLEGKGYVDAMDTTTWVQNKYCVFDFDVIYDIDGNPNTTNDCICYKAGEKVILGTFKPETKANGTKTGKFIDDGEKTGYKYMFYVPLENHEMANAQIHCYAVGLNAGTDTWVENFGTHNYERNDTYYAYHDASKDTTLDLVGQIGGLTLMDTGDFRFSETFKQPLSEWLIKNLVRKVDYHKQNYVIADSVDVRGNNYQAISNSALNTYGTQWYKEKHDKILPFPLTPAKNVNTALRKQPLRPGYATYLSLETIGDYYGEEVNSDTSRKVQIRPLYYKLDLTDGKFTQLDVYMLDNGLYKCINKFDSNETTTEHEWPYYFNWEGEKDRRMVTVSEEAITKKVEPALTFVNKCTINNETGVAETVTGKAIIPKGTHYKFGNAQMLHLRARNRTFVGTDYTNKVWHNGRVGSQDVQDPKVRLNVVSYPALQSPSRPTIFDEVEYNARGQRWHFSLGLPSSTVFVEKGKDPVQEEIEKISNDHSVIVVSLDVKAKGDVWTLQYNGIPTEGQKIQILPDGPVYNYAPDPNGPGSKPIVEVYTSKFSAKDDLSVEGTH